MKKWYKEIEQLRKELFSPVFNTPKSIVLPWVLSRKAPTSWSVRLDLLVEILKKGNPSSMGLTPYQIRLYNRLVKVYEKYADHLYSMELKHFNLNPIETRDYNKYRKIHRKFRSDNDSRNLRSACER